MSSEGKIRIEVQCPDCSGTGLRQGPWEPQGVAAICDGCNGSGEKVLEYASFTGRKPRTDVRIVYWHSDYILGEGMLSRCEAKGISYSDWLMGKLPPRWKG